MLLPKRVKHRRQFRGSMAGKSATFGFKDDAGRLEAAKKTAELWNAGKVIFNGFGD